MTIGLVGSHRVGKTTLAEAVSNDTDLPLILTSTSSVCRDMGIDPAVEMTFAKRMRLQNAILDHLELEWRAELAFITDRTPIDCLMYTTADITSGTAVSAKEYRLYKDYASRCFDLTNQLFSTLVVVQPGIPIIEDTSKATAALNESYMEHLNIIAMGLVRDERIKAKSFYIHRQGLSMNHRVNAVMDAWTKTIEHSGVMELDRSAMH